MSGLIIMNIFISFTPFKILIISRLSNYFKLKKLAYHNILLSLVLAKEDYIARKMNI